MLCLRVPTDAAWVDEALRDVDAVLADHATWTRCSPTTRTAR
jgi:hypothetical protein